MGPDPNFSVPANYSDGSDLDKVVKSIIRRIAAESELWRLKKRY